MAEERFVAYGPMSSKTKEAVRDEFEGRGGTCYIGDKVLVCSAPAAEPPMPKLAPIPDFGLPKAEPINMPAFAEPQVPVFASPSQPGDHQVAKFERAVEPEAAPGA